VCCFCNGRFPDNPSETLQKLYTVAKEHAVVDRESRLYVTDLKYSAPLCARHEFEHDQIPLARDKGYYGINIDWDRLPDRIAGRVGMHAILQILKLPFRSKCYRDIYKYRNEGRDIDDFWSQHFFDEKANCG